MSTKRNFTVEQIQQMLTMYNNGDSYAVIAQRFGCTSSSIMHRLKKLPDFIARTQKQTSRKYEANWDFFDTIDTEHKAYWLGFLYADGYISKSPSRLMGVSLAKKDLAFLYLLKEDMEATHPIIEYKQSNSGYGNEPFVRFVVISDKIVSDLERHGVFSSKTNILMPPTTVPDHLIPHFIRGYFDGDGSWSKSNRGLEYKFALTGTEEMLLWTADKLGIVPRLYQRWPDRSVNCYTLEAQSKSDMQHIISYLYEDAHRMMSRKYDLVSKISPLIE